MGDLLCFKTLSIRSDPEKLVVTSNQYSGRPNGRSQECPMDGGQSRAAGPHGDPRRGDAESGSCAVQCQCQDRSQMDGPLSATGSRRPGRSQFAAAPQPAADRFLLSGKGGCTSPASPQRM